MSLIDLAKGHYSWDQWELAPSKAAPPEQALPVSGEHLMSVNQNWAQSIVSVSAVSRRAAEWYIECALVGAQVLGDSVEIDLRRRGGVPVLKGTGFTLAQTLAELAESSGVDEVAENFDLDVDTIKNMLAGLSALLEKPYTR